MRPHWKEGRRDPLPATPHLRVLMWGLGLSRGPALCIVKESQSVCGLAQWWALVSPQGGLGDVNTS